MGQYGDRHRVTHDVVLMSGLKVDCHIKSRVVFEFKASPQGVYQSVCVVHFCLFGLIVSD